MNQDSLPFVRAQAGGRPTALPLAALAALAMRLASCADAQVWQVDFDLNGNLLAQTAENLAPPKILAQPYAQPLIVGPGELASFFVVAAGTSGLTYQWQFRGANLVGATTDALVLTNVGAATEGQYSVVLSNSSGSVTSNPAMLWFDGNGNGLPDSWEMTYFGNLNQTASGDFDGDGVSNLQEFLDGTNPTNSASAMYQLTVVNDGGTVSYTPNQLRYTNGQTVTLSALPADAFHAWTGDLVTRSNPVNIIINTNKTILARYTPITFFWTNLAGGDWRPVPTGAPTSPLRITMSPS